ncbi:MAG: 50S ribosomal protein L3 [Tepidisphaerales bacterium]
MTPALIGKKIGMTRIFDAKGAIVPVTVVQAGPCVVTQVKTADGRDGYDAVQIAFEEIKPKHQSMALMGHAAKAGTTPKRYFHEVRLAAKSAMQPGAQIDVDIFKDVPFVDVTGTSKGKGFAGVMKRYHFGGQCSSHGTERKHRSRGSISANASWRGQCGKPAKGLRMAGHMGNARVTSLNHALVGTDKDKNLLLIKGALPGANGAVLFIRKSITARIKPVVVETPEDAKGAKGKPAKPAKK